MTKLRHDDRAPCFSAFVTSVRGANMLVVPRECWDSMGDTGVHVEVDISKGPLSRIVQDSCFIAAEATRTSPNTGQVDVYRHDRKDEKPYNVDRYDVIENLADDPQFSKMINASDTQASPALTDYVAGHIFLRRRDPSKASWHWKDEHELPRHIMATMTR
jgi:hypothetical protein